MPGSAARGIVRDMSETFTKLFSSITRSSIWLEDDQTLRVWVTMLALADRSGYVGASVGGLAALARVPREKTEQALSKFCAPDPDSRSKEFEGRRIEVADRGWNILNYQRFRDMRDEEARKEYERNRKREQRAKSVPDGPAMSRTVHRRPRMSLVSANADSEADSEASQNHERTSYAETRAPASSLESMVRVEFSRRFAEAEGTLWTLAGDPAVAQLAAWLATAPGSPTEALGRLLDAFFGDAWCRSQHFPVRHLARYPQKYFEPRDAPGPAKTLE